MADPALRDDIMAVARALEAEPALLGVSAHLLGIGRRLARSKPRDGLYVDAVTRSAAITYDGLPISGGGAHTLRTRGFVAGFNALQSFATAVSLAPLPTTLAVESWRERTFLWDSRRRCLRILTCASREQRLAELASMWRTNAPLSQRRWRRLSTRSRNSDHSEDGIRGSRGVVARDLEHCSL